MHGGVLGEEGDCKGGQAVRDGVEPNFHGGMVLACYSLLEAVNSCLTSIVFKHGVKGASGRLDQLIW